MPTGPASPGAAPTPGPSDLQAPTPPFGARFQHRYRVHLLLFLATLATTTLVGALHYDAFQAAFQMRPPRFDLGMLIGGFWYSGSLLAILGAHEMGHYFMCRRHRVDATLPYFLPVPPPPIVPFYPPVGTLGAFIKIREPFPTKAALFDIGVGGPIAGFVVLVPVLFWGMAHSNIVRMPDDFVGIWLGEPLLFKFAAWTVWGYVADGYSINLHPAAFAAWFALFATAFNLVPFSQLDGGHITYAVFGRRARFVSFGVIGAVSVLPFYSLPWLVPAVIMWLVVWRIGVGHPRVPDESSPLDPLRRTVAFLVVVVFVLCFTAILIEPYQLIENP